MNLPTVMCYYGPKECNMCGMVHKLPENITYWISVKERLPEPSPWPNHRYLVKTKCTHFAHKAVAFLWPRVCNGVNIAYYCREGKWIYQSGLEWESEIIVTHWMPLPDPPVVNHEEDKTEK